MFRQKGSFCVYIYKAELIKINICIGFKRFDRRILKIRQVIR